MKQGATKLTKPKTLITVNVLSDTGGMSSLETQFILVAEHTQAHRNFNDDWLTALSVAKMKNPNTWNVDDVKRFMAKELGWKLTKLKSVDVEY